MRHILNGESLEAARDAVLSYTPAE